MLIDGIRTIWRYRRFVMKPLKSFGDIIILQRIAEATSVGCPDSALTTLECAVTSAAFHLFLVRFRIALEFTKCILLIAGIENDQYRAQ